ncbi:MAG: tRNA lysidine(34) synthetase TilS [Oscillospiraceae bacterium]|nr:tRNA lysidine(34) synthetase TilS [Oscillospiraceae bacterium]
MIEMLVAKAIADYKMLSLSNEITVALSGGADSVCLLYALNELKGKLGITLSAAHLNHSIRGSEADRDEAFVKELCSSLGIPLACEKIDVPEYAKSHSLSLELAARQVRYDFLARVSKGVVATAHSADDNLETVVFNLARGTALKGLCGIPPVRDRIIRPLIYCSRVDIEQYCEENGLSYVTDSTNLSDDYTRNKIRHNIVPVLKEVNPAVARAVTRMSESLSLDNDLLENLAEEEYKKRIVDGLLDIKGFDKIHKAVSLRVLKCFLNDLDVLEFSSKHLEQLYNICVRGGEISLPKAVFVSESGRLHIKTDTLSNKEYKVEVLPIEKSEFLSSKKINNLLLKNYLDCDRIIGKLEIRTKLSGDTIKLKNKNGTKTLTKLYNEYRIPLTERKTLPVLCDDEGVVWVYKIGVAERCAADENSKSILKISIS